MIRLLRDSAIQRRQDLKREKSLKEMNFPLNRSRFDSILHNNLESFALCYLVYPREVLEVLDRLFSRRCICFLKVKGRRQREGRSEKEILTTSSSNL